jgi:hypothetical protein
MWPETSITSFILRPMGILGHELLSSCARDFDLDATARKK